MTDLALLAALAHPDDETFRPGGTLALLARQGVRVQVLPWLYSFSPCTFWRAGSIERGKEDGHVGRKI